MATSAIEAKVKSIIADQLGVGEDEIKPESSFIEDLGADSLDIVELVMEFEKAFNLQIPDEDAEKIASVGDAEITLNNGNKAHVTMHLIEGGEKEIRRILNQSLDAFFEFYPEI